MVRLLDTTLLTAIATVLIVRTQLWLTNYPQLGGRGLHIAHLLWGGLFMLLALIILLAFLSPRERGAAAVIGGIGLGLFIDELGKFITADNNYFFKPTAAIIYCFFVCLFLVVRQLERGRDFSEREYLVNAIEMLKGTALGTMTEENRRRALALLEHSDPSDPLMPELRRIVAGAAAVPTTSPAAGEEAARHIRGWVERLVHEAWFTTALVAFFAVWTAASLAQVIVLVSFGTPDGGAAEVFRLGRDITSNPLSEGEQTFIRVANVAATVVASAFSLIGIRRIAEGRRAAAFSMFERALLVSIFFTQVFAFVHSQFAAVFGLLLNVLLFVAVRTILTQELERVALQTDDVVSARPFPAGSGSRPRRSASSKNDEACLGARSRLTETGLRQTPGGM